uniref:BAH domain-containing protein n=1 Tax=Davidia involucrata TaxID=16924 RepID=A0A5B7B327_DAVIN
MAANGHCFVEWKEQFVSKERGNRVVHYFLKDISGDSVLAVVGTERSVRHMFYVVSEEFLNVYKSENSVYAGYRWRSRREVVNWLTSMLSKQLRQGDQSKSPKNDATSGVSAQQTDMPDYKGCLARNLKGHASDIVWSGVAWTCGKQLKHYSAFCRNETRIAVQSFVFVMAEKENRYLAYLEDMYEDRKGHKKVKVRWFHHIQEVKGVISIRNPHPKEVFITPYAQVISVECVDGLAIVLSREHYEKCATIFPHALLSRVHLCSRQFRSNRAKPFKMSKLRGYFDQPIFSCLDPDFFEDEEFSLGDNVKLGAKRTRSCRERQMLTYEPSYEKYGLLSRRLLPHKPAEHQPWHTGLFKVNEKIELLCQDSGIRGCWFRCTVLEVSRRQMKVQYDDVKDEDGCGNLEEWVPTFRLAMPDKLGMRCSGRPTIRPACPSHGQIDLAFEVGTPLDVWWSDGWWEGIVTGISNHGDESLQIYIPSENLFLNIHKKNLRVSRDWMGDQWVDIETNPDILSAISATISQDTNLSVSAVANEVKSDGFPMSCDEVPSGTKLDIVEDKKLDLVVMAPSDGPLNDIDRVNDEKQPLIEDKYNEDNGNHANDSHEVGNVDYVHGNDDDVDKYHNDDDDNNDVGDEGENGDRLEIEEFETAVQKCEPELMEVVA